MLGGLEVIPAFVTEALQMRVGECPDQTGLADDLFFSSASELRAVVREDVTAVDTVDGGIEPIRQDLLGELAAH